MSQQNPNPQQDDAVHVPRSKSRRDRPFAIEYLSNWGKSMKWRVWKRYRTAQERDDALEGLSRKFSFYQWRIAPDGQDQG